MEKATQICLSISLSNTDKVLSQSNERYIYMYMCIAYVITCTLPITILTCESSLSST